MEVIAIARACEAAQLAQHSQPQPPQATGAFDRQQQQWTLKDDLAELVDTDTEHALGDLCIKSPAARRAIIAYFQQANPLRQSSCVAGPRRASISCPQPRRTSTFHGAGAVPGRPRRARAASLSESSSSSGRCIGPDGGSPGSRAGSSLAARGLGGRHRS